LINIFSRTKVETFDKNIQTLSSSIKVRKNGEMPRRSGSENSGSPTGS